MRSRFASVAAVVLAAIAGSAQAGDLERADAREYDSSSFAAQAYYRLEFGGSRAATATAAADATPRAPLRHSFGFRMDNERAAAWGAPAVFRLQFGAHDLGARGLGGLGLEIVAVNGLDLRSVVSLHQGETPGFFSNLTVAQWFALGLATVITTSIVVDAADSGKETTTTTTGTGAT